MLWVHGEKGERDKVDKQKLSILVVSIILAFILVAFFLYYSTPTQTTQPPTKRSLHVFLDENLAEQLESGEKVFWSHAHPGENNRSLWMVNTGENVIVQLILVPPPLPTNWSLTWNYDGSEMGPNEVLEVTLTLHIPEAAAETKVGLHFSVFSIEKIEEKIN